LRRRGHRAIYAAHCDGAALDTGLPGACGIHSRKRGTDPPDDESIDTIVTTFTLCSIQNAPAALAEMRRVLKPSGRLLFLERGLAPERSVCRWQVLLAPAWKRVAGGCELNRPIDKMIEDAGFKFDRLKTGYMPGPKQITFLYEGSAKPY
jgi:SAM-dependent methyltransferase